MSSQLPLTPDPPADPGEPALTTAIRGLGLLSLFGLAVGFFAAVLFIPEEISTFIGSNSIARSARLVMALLPLAGAFVAAVTGLVLLRVWRKRKGAPSAGARLLAIGRRLMPASLVAFLPLLFHPVMWHGAALTFAVFLLVFVLATEAAFRSAALAPPLFPSLGPRLHGAWKKLPLTGSPWARARVPLLIVVSAALAYAIFFSYYTIQFHHYLHSASFDLGLEDNLVWNLVFGGHFFKSTPFSGPTGSHFGHHATFIAYVFAPIYAIFPRPETLLILQAVFMGAAAIPLFLFARRHLGQPLALVVALAYLLYPPVHGANLYEFHYLPLGPFFLWMTLYLLEARKDRWAIPFLILGLAVREDVAMGFGILGAYLVLTGERPRAGVLVALAGTATFVGLKFGIMPLMHGGSSFAFMYEGLMPQGMRGFGGVLVTVVTNPVYTLDSLLRMEKLVYLLQLLVPLAFLPFRRRLGLLLALPGFFFTLLSTGYSPLVEISFQYSTYWTAYMFVGVVATLAWLGKDRRRAAAIALVCGMIPASFQYGAFCKRETTRGGFGYYSFTVTEQDQLRRQHVDDLLPLIPADAAISSSENLVPQVSSREFSYTLRMGVFDAEYVFFTFPNGGEERTHVEEALRSGRFGIVDSRPGFALARRGHDTSQNETILKQL